MIGLAFLGLALEMDKKVKEHPVKKQRGFTIIEILVVFAVLAALGIAGTALYVISHFITKFW